MGRLQRKKTIKKKKKKNSVDDKLGQLPLDTGKDGQKVLSSVTYKPAVKDPYSVVNRRSGQINVPKPQFIENAIQFLREVKIELKKVTWPPRKQTLGSTTVVIILVLIFSVFFGVVDAGLSGIVRFIY